jgi:hypothetical protein
MPTPRQYDTNAARQAAYRARHRATTPATSRSSVPQVTGPRRWTVGSRHAQEILARVAQEMASYWDDRSEAWQNSERGEQLTDRIAAMEDILDMLNEV